MNADLTGRWSGIFNYPHSNPPTAFEAELADREGSFVGTVREPDLHSTPPGAPIAASVDGTHDGAAVSFTKFYDEGAGDYDTVLYQGVLNADATEISGGWTIPGTWAGTFLMVRASPVANEEELADAAARDLDEPADEEPVRPVADPTD